MAFCDCILSDNTLKHLKIIQKMLQKDSSFSSRSDTLGILFRYILCDIDKISLDDLALLDDYFLKHPTFLYAFKNDVLMSATFY